MRLQWRWLFCRTRPPGRLVDQDRDAGAGGGPLGGLALVRGGQIVLSKLPVGDPSCAVGAYVVGGEFYRFRHVGDGPCQLASRSVPDTAIKVTIGEEAVVARRQDLNVLVEIGDRFVPLFAAAVG